MSRKFSGIQHGLGLFDWEAQHIGSAAPTISEMALPLREPESALIGAATVTTTKTDPRPILYGVPTVRTDADEIAAIRTRRDHAAECLAIARKSTGGERLADSYLAELGELQRRLWDLGVR